MTLETPPAPATDLAAVQRLHQAFMAGDLAAAGREAEDMLARGVHGGETHNVLGMIAHRRGEPAAAQAAFERSLAVQPGQAHVLSNLGAARRSQGDLTGAEAAYRQALEINPDLQEAYANIANLLSDQRRPAEAEAAVGQALAKGAATANMMMTLGIARFQQGKLVGAAEAFQRALALDPQHFEACRNLGATLASLTHFAEAEQLNRRALALRPDFAAGYSSLLFGLNYRPELSGERIAAEFRGFDERYGAPLRSLHRPHANRPDPDRRLRLGYVSPDFNDHVVSAFMLPLLEAHDRSAFEVIAYAEVRKRDATSERVMALTDGWVSTVGLSDAAVAERMRADGVDILVDLAGHTTGNRLLALAQRPAPVQLTYFVGHGYTTGLSALDGFIADAALVPPGAEALFSEPILRMDRIPLVYVAPPAAPAVSPPPALRNGHVTFGHFGRSIRLNARVIAAWAAILNAVPGSRLVLNNAPFGDPAVAGLFAAQFAAHGVARERLELIFTTPQTKTWAAYGDIDIALDPFPHNAGTTTVEALWMGAPVLSLADRPSVGRFGAMILGALGLEDWVAGGVEAYVAKAVEAASDLAGLARLREGMRGRFQASALGDAPGLARAMEGLYRSAWRRWCAGR
jgi:protein O-GlcNAc transferase